MEMRSESFSINEDGLGRLIKIVDVPIFISFPLLFLEFVSQGGERPFQTVSRDSEAQLITHNFFCWFCYFFRTLSLG